jgi:gliding motility associated protien GldN
MKKIWGISSRLGCTLLLALACTSMVEAQSSVRRVPRKDNTTTSASAKTTDKTADKTTSKAADKKITKPAATSTQTDKATKPTTENTAVKRNTAATKKPAATATTVTGDQVTLRAQAFDEYQRLDETSDASWQRTVYRELDVTKGSNASLYYPEEPTDGLTNFFRVVLDLVVSGRVKAYEYLDGREVFSDKYVIRVQDMLSKFQIYYTEQPATGRAAAAIKVDENDVPSNEVLSYFLKERWEFDRTTSHYGPRVVALCPVLHRSGDFGGDAFKYPMFWVRYEDLRPYLRQQLIVSDGMNAAPRYTMEDFFNLAQYEGDIYKTQNLRGLSLMQQYPDADTLKMKQAELDRDLRRFADSIWVSEPSPEEAAASSKKTDTRAARNSRTADKSTTTTAASDRSTDTKKVNRRTKEAVDVAAAEAEKEAKADELEAAADRNGAARSVRRSARR